MVSQAGEVDSAFGSYRALRAAAPDAPAAAMLLGALAKAAGPAGADAAGMLRGEVPPAPPLPAAHVDALEATAFGAPHGPNSASVWDVEVVGACVPAAQAEGDWEGLGCHGCGLHKDDYAWWWRTTVSHVEHRGTVLLQPVCTVCAPAMCWGGLPVQLRQVAWGLTHA